MNNFYASRKDNLGETDKFLELILLFSNYPKILKEEECFEIHSTRPQLPDAKIDKYITHTQRKLQANIIDEHRCKSFLQNISKQNPTKH